MSSKPSATHIIPLCTSTLTAGLALFQYPVFLSWLYTRPSIAGRPLSQYWESFLTTSLGTIALPCLISTTTALLARRRMLANPGSVTNFTASNAAAAWYLYGAGLTLAHFAFVPVVAGQIRMVMRGREDPREDRSVDKPRDYEGDQECEEANRYWMMRWLRVHTARTLLVDLPAVWCFAKGFGAAFM